MAIDSLRGGLCLILGAGLLLRPAQLDALLIHSHGDGGHVHALTRTDVGLYQQEHDRLHELEHAGVHSGDGERAIQESADHNEECGAILVVFGEMKGATASPRFDAGARHLSIDTTTLTANVAGDQHHVSHRFLDCRRLSDATSSRSLDAILQSSHAILI